jgi:hypothetical protein
MNKAGRPPSFETPDEMWEAFSDYCKKAKAQPVRVEDYVGVKADRVLRERENPLTFEGFQVYCYEQGIGKSIDQYFTNPDGRYDKFVEICTRIKTTIRADQIRGGMTGIYNTSITQRLNGLADKTQAEVKIEQPLFND